MFSFKNKKRERNMVVLVAIHIYNKENASKQK